MLKRISHVNIRYCKYCNIKEKVMLPRKSQTDVTTATSKEVDTFHLDYLSNVLPN